MAPFYIQFLIPLRKFGTDTLDPTGRANLEANIVSMLQAGCFFGALGASWVADKYGRKPALILSAIIAFIGTVMQTASLGRLGVMYAGRYVLQLMNSWEGS